MATTRIRKTVRMTPEQVTWLEQRAQELGVSQSAVVRMELRADMTKIFSEQSSNPTEAR